MLPQYFHFIFKFLLHFVEIIMLEGQYLHRHCGSQIISSKYYKKRDKEKAINEILKNICSTT